MPKYSFDIFDTVLFRLVANPKDIFFAMKSHLVNNGNEDVKRISHAFHHIRLFSEFKARRIVHRDDIQLDDIYHTMQSDFHLSSESIRFIKQTELETEEKYLVPNENIYHSLKTIRDLTGSVIYISDMYLPTEFIKSILVKYGLYKDQDRIYVSGDMGLTKSSGRLFKQVLNNEHIEPVELNHVGDNSHSDYFVPRCLGINAELFGGNPELKSRHRRSIYRQKLWYIMEILWAGLMSLRCKWTQRS